MNVITEEPGNFTNLALATFLKNNSHPGTFIGNFFEIDPGRRGHLAIQLDPIPPIAQRIGVRRAVEQGAILFFNIVAWVGEPLCQRAIIGQQDKPLAVLIEPANRK